MSEPMRPPTPGSGIALGFSNAIAFSNDPFGSLERWADYGDLVRIEFPGETLYLVTDPSLIETILHDGNDRFTIAKQQRRAFAGVEDRAVTTATNDRWRRLRTALHPAFTRDTIDQYADAMVDRTVARVDSWADGEVIDLHHEMRLLTLDVLGATLLGVDIRGNEDVVFRATDALVDRGDPRRPGQLLPGWVPTPTDLRFKRAVADLDVLVDRCLDELREMDSADARSVLLDAHDRGAVTMEEVRHNLVALLLAGSDTTALALTYCWYLLSNHPDVRRSLTAEYDDSVGAGIERPTVDSLSRLETVEHVVEETLRLFPPTWNTMRETTRSVTVGDYRLPEGAALMLSQWVVHRDDRFWDEPTAFRPDRWAADADRPAYAYFPFSGGPRHCIGMHFARLELRLSLAAMVGRVELAVSSDGPLTFAPTLSLRPETDLTATVTRR